MNIYAIFYEGESYNEAGEVTEVILDGNLPNQNYEHPKYGSFSSNIQSPRNR